MAFDAEHGRYLVWSVLEMYEWNSPGAVELLLLTMAAESEFGTYLYQVGGGPALGVYQMERKTEADIWNNWLRYRDVERRKVMGYSGVYGPGDIRHLSFNLEYQTAMARIKYLREPEPIPDADDVLSLAKYWKRYWNTYRGKGTVAGAVEKYGRYVGL